MKSLHRPDLFCWSSFDESRNVDFHGYLWVREGGNVAIDPMPLSPHDLAHLEASGPLGWIVITNSDHTRAAQELAARTGAKIAAPAAERATFPCPADLWLEEGDEPVPGLQVFALTGSKTPGELCLRVGDTLITGDLVRAHLGGSLMILPDPKLTDKGAAVASVRRLAGLEGIEAVLVGDGWPVFRDGGARLRELAQRLG